MEPPTATPGQSYDRQSPALEIGQLHPGAGKHLARNGITTSRQRL